MLAIKEWADKVKEIQTKLKATLKVAQKRQAEVYDRKHKAAPPFKLEEKMQLLRHYIKMKQPLDKLDNKQLGLFEIKEVVGCNARHLILPETI